MTGWYRGFLRFLGCGGLIFLLACGSAGPAVTSSKDTDSGRIHFEAGTRFLKENELASAQRELEEARRINPELPLVRHSLGEVYLRSGRYVQAMEELDASLQLLGNENTGPELVAEVYLHAGEAAYHLGRFNQAQRFLIKARDLAPEGQVTRRAEELLSLLQEKEGSFSYVKGIYENQVLGCRLRLPEPNTWHINPSRGFVDGEGGVLFWASQEQTSVSLYVFVMQDREHHKPDLDSAFGRIKDKILEGVGLNVGEFRSDEQQVGGQRTIVWETLEELAPGGYRYITHNFIFRNPFLYDLAFTAHQPFAEHESEWEPIIQSLTITAQ